MSYLLIAGCGPQGTPLPKEYAGYRQVRLDICPAHAPDVVASIVSMPMVADAHFDVVLCSHCLEHLYAHEVPMALAEFYRVLKVGGLVDIRVPDLQGIGGRIGLGEIDDFLYQSGAGPIAPLDLLYGHRPAVASGQYAMAHKTGFTANLLTRRLKEAGFVYVIVARGLDLELRATARKGVIPHAGEEPETTELPQLEVRARLGEAAPLRQQGQVAQVRPQESQKALTLDKLSAIADKVAMEIFGGNFSFSTRPISDTALRVQLPGGADVISLGPEGVEQPWENGKPNPEAYLRYHWGIMKRQNEQARKENAVA